MGVQAAQRGLPNGGVGARAVRPEFGFGAVGWPLPPYLCPVLEEAGIMANATAKANCPPPPPGASAPRQLAIANMLSVEAD